jgi:hypothetical protein
MIIAVAIPSNTKIAKSGATVVGPFMTLNALEPIRAFSGHSVRLSSFNTKEFTVIYIFR